MLYSKKKDHVDITGSPVMVWKMTPVLDGKSMQIMHQQQTPRQLHVGFWYTLGLMMHVKRYIIIFDADPEKNFHVTMKHSSPFPTRYERTINISSDQWESVAEWSQIIHAKCFYLYILFCYKKKNSPSNILYGLNKKNYYSCVQNEIYQTYPMLPRKRKHIKWNVYNKKRLEKVT